MDHTLTVIFDMKFGGTLQHIAGYIEKNNVVFMKYIQDKLSLLLPNYDELVPKIIPRLL